MCIQIRVTYPRCLHVHLGYERCGRVDSETGQCSEFETHPRDDPFCPLCSKLEYRAHKSTERVNAAQNLRSNRLQPQSEYRYDAGKPKAANGSDKPRSDKKVHSSFILSENPRAQTDYSPPSPVEPPIDPWLLGPQQFLKYGQRQPTKGSSQDGKPESPRKDSQRPKS